ncbi:MAG: ABC transporter substrate-binding protein [Rhizobiaceae bacterium]|nr:ABC transporter substrate-binding protein [Rhizobiaceae bacterium]
MSVFGFRRHLRVALAALVLIGGPALADEAAPVDASRLVTIGGAVTEIVFDLGLGDKVVARDTTSYFPEAVNKLPDIGYMRALSPEGVLSVNPSAILMIEGSGPRETLDVLGKASVPLVTVPEGYDRDAIVKKILTVGKALDAEAKARALADEVAADIDAAVADASKVPEDKRKRVLFVLTVQNGKIMAAGSHTAADGILRLAGAVNATGGFHGYKPINDEAVIEARPDVILMMTHGGPIVDDEEILSNPAVALTPAGKDRRIIRMSSLTMLGFGPRTADAIRDLSKSLYGG